MKNIYLFTSLLFLIVSPFLATPVEAQCLCSGGLPPTAITQTLTLPPTKVSTLTFNFQQFDPALGTLNCVSLQDTVTGTSITGARNTGPDSTDFLFLLSLTSKISGPGINITHPFSHTYGYDNLKAYGQAGDTITYGPANIITNPTDSASTSGNAAYLGTGTVPVTFAVNGGMITQDGGSNYKSSVSTTIGGTMKLTYLYCPAALLATNLLEFSAARKDNNILLNWNAKNDQVSRFDIEYSVDGKEFTTLTAVAPNHDAVNSNYRYTYNIRQAGAGSIYFRIKQTGMDNKPGYSVVRKVTLTDQNSDGIAIYPNPAITGVSVAFGHPVSGDYSVAIVNMAGQVVMEKKASLNNTTILPVSWSVKPAPGVYFTRVTNTHTLEQQMMRVVIR